MNRSASNLICGPPRRNVFLAAALLVLATAATPSLAQWVQFANETSARMDVASDKGPTDPNEKAYAWGDIDKDGDLDMVVARKEGFTSGLGKRVNVLFINEEGVLTDRTADFAVDADVVGDMGFNTPTNDRDVILADLTGDGWLDMVTSTALSNGDPKHIGYPRIYRNKGCISGSQISCTTDDWLGFRFENNRMPVMLTDNGQSGFNPCFCQVSAGDVSGDGYADLYFVSYDSGCNADFNDKLLINQGVVNPGFFTDVTETNFVGAASDFPVSAFGASGGIGKFNADGSNDILKQFAGFVGLGYNSSTMGTFDKDNSPTGGSTYFVSAADLNKDGKLDLVTSDDGQDRYLLNQGDGADDMADYISFAFSYTNGATDDGFSGNSVLADLNNDGWTDAVVTDNDVDVGGCSRRTHIFRNLGGTVGGNVTMQEQTSGTQCQNNIFGNSPNCLVATIPADKLTGGHDAAVFDINGDGWKDLVLGRCSGTQVYMNVPPFIPSGSVPDGNENPGQGITVDRNGSSLTLTWGESCNINDADYVVYAGALTEIDGSNGNFTSHTPITCSTSGATTLTFDVGTGPENAYYLVGPRNEDVQGALGKKSNGGWRHAGGLSCLPQQIGACN
jgi:hypothetical protein